jgi:hypothetical protein
MYKTCTCSIKKSTLWRGGGREWQHTMNEVDAGRDHAAPTSVRHEDVEPQEEGEDLFKPKAMNEMDAGRHRATPALVDEPKWCTAELRRLPDRHSG